MNALIKTIFAWILHKFMTLLVILLVLVLAVIGVKKWKEFQQHKTDLKVVYSVNESFDNENDNLIEIYTGPINEIYNSIDKGSKGERAKALEPLNGLIGKYEQRIDALRKNQKQNDTLVDVLKGHPLHDVLKDALLREVEIELLRQSLEYSKALREKLITEDDTRKEYGSLERQRSEILVPEIHITNSAIAQLKKDHPVIILVPRSGPYKEYRRLLKKKAVLDEEFEKLFMKMVQLQKRLEGFGSLGSLGVFKVERDAFKGINTQLLKKFDGLNKTIDDSLFGIISKLVKENLSLALKILLGIILMPILFKMLFYFVLAPLAARRPPLQLLPGTSGDLTLETGNPAVSRPVVVDAEHELLVHSDFLQSSSDCGFKDTNWFLNKKRPLTSLASGMVALTRIRTDSPETFVISATKESLSEVGILSIPQGAALVMQPHNLVGIVQLKDSPIHITSHWRLHSLHAWLTLQLRYLAFHGPAQLIVQGCRGIKIEQADGGRSINQASTIGFSANLAYSTRRSETFFAYLLGKRELLNDNFSGDNGFYVYEEMPYSGKKSGFLTRGLEGVTDSLLKVFGI